MLFLLSFRQNVLPWPLLSPMSAADDVAPPRTVIASRVACSSLRRGRTRFDDVETITDAARVIQTLLDMGKESR